MHRYSHILIRLFVIEIALSLALPVGTIIASPNSVETWTPAVEISAAVGRCRRASLASDPTTGDVHIVWEEHRASQWVLRHRYWRAGDNQWTIPMALTDLPQRQEAPALAFDQSGNGHLLWTRRHLPSPDTEEEPSTDLVYRHWNGQAWSSEQILYHVDAYLAAPYTLALLEIDHAMQLFVSYASAVRQAQWANGSWSPLSEWDYTLDIDIAAAVQDAAGNIHVAGYGDNSGTGEWDEYFADAYYATFDGNAWSAPVNLSSVDGAAYDIDLAFDAAGDLHFVWSDQGSPFSSETTVSTVFERVFDGDSWSANAAIIQFNADQGVQDLELKADPEGDLHLAWAEGVLVDYAVTDLRIYYQGFDGMDWSEEEQVHDGPVGSWNVSMNVDGDALFLAWEEWPYGTETIYFSSTRSDMRPPSISRIWFPKIKKG